MRQIQSKEPETINPICKNAFTLHLRSCKRNGNLARHKNKTHHLCKLCLKSIAFTVKTKNTLTSTLLQCKRQQTRGNKGHAVHPWVWKWWPWCVVWEASKLALKSPLGRLINLYCSLSVQNSARRDCRDWHPNFAIVLAWQWPQLTVYAASDRMKLGATN